MTAHDDAITLGWTRDHAGHWWAGDARIVEVYRTEATPTWWTDDGMNAHPSEDAALEAAISATPYARALIEARREIATLRATADDYRTEHAAAWAALRDRGTGDLAEAIGGVLAEVAALRALVPEVGEWSCGEWMHGWPMLYRLYRGVYYSGNGLERVAMRIKQMGAEARRWRLEIWPPNEHGDQLYRHEMDGDRDAAIRDCEAAARRLGVLP